MKKILALIFLLISCLATSCDNGNDDPKLTRPDLPSEVVFGLDWLAAQHPQFQVGKALEMIGSDEKFPIGILDQTFGEDLSAVDLILSSGKTDHFRVHFINGPCIRNNNCQSYDYGHTHNISSFNRSVKRRDPRILNLLRNRVEAYCSLVDKYKDTVRFYFSWSLEHDLDFPAWEILDGVGRQACPRNDYYVVNNPVGSNGGFPKVPRPGVLFESHNFNLRPESTIGSLDGEPARQIDAVQWAEKNFFVRSKLAFTWDWVHNCRPDAGFIPPRARTDCPTLVEHLRYINFTRAAQNHIDNKGAPPQPIPTPPDAPIMTIFESFRDGGGKNLWKPRAESENTVAILTDTKHPEMECRVQKNNGEWETLNCKKGAWNNFDCCTNDNGNRCTYRTSKSCENYKEPKVVCKGSSYNLEISSTGGGACQRHD